MVIPLPAGNFTNLFMLGAMVNNITGRLQTFIVKYTDGTSTTFNQNMSDWFNAAGWPGESVISCQEDRNFSDGTTIPSSRIQFASTGTKSRSIPTRQYRASSCQTPGIL